MRIRATNTKSMSLMLVLAAAAGAALWSLPAGFAQTSANAPPKAQAKPKAAAASEAKSSTAAGPYGVDAFLGIGSTKETAADKRAEGTFYKGAGVITIVGKPHKLGIQEDEGAYALDVAPNKDKDLPYNHHLMTAVWEVLPMTDIPETLSSRVPPMTPAAKAKLALTRTGEGPRGVAKDQNDPEEICDPDGWPRIVFQPIRPVEFITIPGRVLEHWAWHDVWRTDWTDGRLLPTDPDPTFWGYNVGKWVGEIFVVDTNGVDDRSWLDRYGSPHSSNMEVQARWHRVDHNTLALGLTLKDPEMYTETWNGDDILFKLYPKLEVDSLPCIPSEEIEYRDQIRSSYPDDKDLHTPVKNNGVPTTVLPRVEGAKITAPSN